MDVEHGSLRIGLVGCGEVTKAKHLPALTSIPGISVVGLCDLDHHRCCDIADRFKVSQRFIRLEDLLKVPQLDAVGICLPPGVHADAAVSALKARKHVWIDKPLALNDRDCRRIIDAAQSAGTVAMVGFHMRFHRLIRPLQDHLRTLDPAAIESVHVVWHSPRGDQNIPEWKTHRASGGGALIEIAVHQFDLVRFLLRSEWDVIFASTRCGIRDDECAVITGRMSDGTLVTGEFSERAPHQIEIQINAKDRMIRLDCLRFDGFEVRYGREVPGDPKQRIRSLCRFAKSLPAGIGLLRTGGDYRHSYRQAWKHFAQKISGGEAPEASLVDGLRSTEVICAALQSMETGLPVKVRSVETRVCWSVGS